MEELNQELFKEEIEEIPEKIIKFLINYSFLSADIMIEKLKEKIKEKKHEKLINYIKVLCEVKDIIVRMIEEKILNNVVVKIDNFEKIFNDVLCTMPELAKKINGDFRSIELVELMFKINMSALGYDVCEHLDLNYNEIYNVIIVTKIANVIN